MCQRAGWNEVTCVVKWAGMNGEFMPCLSLLSTSHQLDGHMNNAQTWPIKDPYDGNDIIQNAIKPLHRNSVKNFCFT